MGASRHPKTWCGGGTSKSDCLSGDDDWCSQPETVGLGLHLPAKWIGPDGRQFWMIFSSTGDLDRFNLLQGSFTLGDGLIFADGFENGSTNSWSSVAGLETTAPDELDNPEF